MNIARIREHLAKADKDIKKGDARIRKQEKLIKALASDGHATEVAKETLKDFKKLQGTMEKHRDLVREELKRERTAPQKVESVK